VAEVKRTERGWVAHFVCASRCAFRRNTLLECGEQRVVVSTVGNMRKLAVEGPGTEEIGIGRFYETMAFRAVFEDPYWEADISNQVNFESPRAISDAKQDADLRANAMHEAVVAEISGKLQEEVAGG